MRQDLLQAFAVCYYCNDAAGRGSLDRFSEMRVHHSSFKPVYEVGFERKGFAQHGAEGVAQWYKRLYKEGAERLQLYLGSISATHAKDDPEPWGILSETERGLEMWCPAWRHRPVAKSDPQPFIVVYTADRFNRWNVNKPESNEVATANLVSILDRCSAALRAEGKYTYSNAFDNCVLQHKQGLTTHGFARDIVPDTAPVAHIRSVASALRICEMLWSESWKEACAQQSGLKFIGEEIWRAAVAVLESVAAEAGLFAQADGTRVA